jgi:ParB-like chromosome segregation protein Spo0J
MTEVHPLAAIFPMMSEPELQDLADDIKEHGLLHPIVLSGDGEVLIDGRNRLKACEMAGVKPTFVRLNGEDQAAYIVSANINRRQMTAGQQAIARALVYPKPRTLRNLNSAESARLSQARLILHSLGETIARSILAGTKQFDEALKEASEKRDKQVRHIRMSELRDHAPDLAELVTEGKMTLDEACAAHEERKRKAAEDERYRRETIVRIMEETYRGGMGLANEEFVGGVRQRLADPEFRRALKQRMRVLSVPTGRPTLARSTVRWKALPPILRPGRRMQSRVEREPLLQSHVVEAFGLARIEDKIPAERGHHARDCYEAMVAKKIVAKGLLAAARNAWPQPVGVRHGVRLNNMDRLRFGDQRRRDHMRHGVKRPETRVDRHFQDGGRRIDGAVDGVDAPAVPAAANPGRSIPAIPGRRAVASVETPNYEFGSAQRRWEGRHV